MSLSQEEIDALLNSTSIADDEDDAAEEVISGDTAPTLTVTPEEADILGEVGNMCMGAVAKTMNIVLDRRVNITTPRVTVLTTAEVLSLYQVPYIVVEIEYIEGISGNNLLLLKEPDAAMITDIMMGGDGTIQEPIELSELHMSAINEIMNQMIAASAKAMSEIIGEPVNISPPTSNRVSGAEDTHGMFDDTETVIMISFEMEIENLLNSQLLQLMPYHVGCDLAKKLQEALLNETNALPEPPPPPPPPVQTAAPQQITPPAQQQYAPPAQQQYAPETQQPQYPPPPHPSPNLVGIRPPQFTSFDAVSDKNTQNKGINIVSDIPLQVSVEVGRTRKEINEILNFSVGTIVELDKITGDPLEMFVNGKLIARCEVVAVGENYGVRILEIIHGK